MTRTRLTIALFMFVLSSALLPQAVFAQPYTVCADEANPQSCVASRAELPAVQQFGPAARRTTCADDANPQSCVVRISQFSAVRARRANVHGTARVDQSVTAGTVGIGQAQATPARHAPSGGYGPNYAEE